jgi:hypothetical protein
MRAASRRAAGAKAAGFLVIVMAASWRPVPAASAGDGEVRPGDATWHVGLVDLWGKDSKGQSRQLDIYCVFEQGRWARAVATARRFNTSVHLVEQADVKLDGQKITGRLEVLLTPDRWVPKDGQPVALAVEIDGRLVRGGDGKQSVEGAYKGMLGGQAVSGKLTGGVGATEAGWNDSRWSFLLNPVVEPGGTDAEQIQVVLGVAEGKVQWGLIGVTWRRSPHRECFFETSGLRLDGATVTGAFHVPARAIEIGCDPKGVCEVELTGHRVQGLNGGKARIVTKLGGKALGAGRMAYGRGSASKGGGRLDAAAPRPLWRYDLDTAPWWVPTQGHEPLQPGEHPRLLFRRKDVAGLRQKAQTPEGKAIVARLRALLGGGEALPTTFNPTPPHNNDKSPKLPIGTFTTWHGAGYGMLYQLSGERKYADLARKAVQLAFDGKVDRDNRYAWISPGTGLRAGSVLTAIALAYDLCYDAWPDDFRRKVALEIQDYHKKDPDGGTTITLTYLAGRTGYPPSSNHYGAHMGAAAAVLGILGDPGTDTELLQQRLAELERNLPRILSQGFGDRGWYSEGPHPARVSSNCGLQEVLMALRSAAGRDYVRARPNAQWITLRWIMEVVPVGGRPHFPSRGVYGTEQFDGSGQSHSGDIAYGFGTIDEKYKPALLWVYKHFIEPDRANYGANTYPHRAIAALVNWPVGVEPANPAEVMPKAVADTIHGYFVSRNRWQDDKDIVITNLLNIGPEGYHRVKDAGTIRLWGLGVRAQWKTGLGGATPVYYKAEDDGSSVLSVVSRGEISSLAVDLSGASGSPAMLVGTGAAFAKTSHGPPGKKGGASTHLAEAKAGGRSFAILSLQDGPAPRPAARGDAVTLGGQTIRFDGTKLILGSP